MKQSIKGLHKRNMPTIERPLDFLNDLKVQNKRVLVEIKGDRKPVEGKLWAFDIHINLVIETDKGMKFIKGDVIETVSPIK